MEWLDTQQTPQPLWDAREPFLDRFATLRRDLEHFCREFSTIKNGIKELRETLHERLDLTHNRRNFTITIVAAIYLPLSFATSFFGMNMNTTTSAGPQGFSNWTTSWIEDSPADIQNSTKALVSTIGSSGTPSYSWKTFIITALCLLITLPLSLGIGGVLSLAYRGTTYYATYWRIFAIFPSVAFIFFGIFGWFLPFFGSLFIYWMCN
jgi:ABC-type phosphate transport system permease subunit